MFAQQWETYVEFMAYLSELKNGNFDTNARVSIGYFLEIMGLQLYQVKYPAFCSVDIADIIIKGHIYNCGFHGEEYRVEPLHSRDPYMDFSGLRFWLNALYGRHSVVDLEPNWIMS